MPDWELICGWNELKRFEMKALSYDGKSYVPKGKQGDYEGNPIFEFVSKREGYTGVRTWCPLIKVDCHDPSIDCCFVRLYDEDGKKSIPFKEFYRNHWRIISDTFLHV